MILFSDLFVTVIYLQFLNALEVHGLDKCPNYGIEGFKRYVALAIVARNIRRIGDILWQQDVERKRKAIKRKLKYQQAA